MVYYINVYQMYFMYLKVQVIYVDSGKPNDFLWKHIFSLFHRPAQKVQQWWPVASGHQEKHPHWECQNTRIFSSTPPLEEKKKGVPLLLQKLHRTSVCGRCRSCAGSCCRFTEKMVLEKKKKMRRNDDDVGLHAAHGGGGSALLCPEKATNLIMIRCGHRTHLSSQ